MTTLTAKYRDGSPAKRGDTLVILHNGHLLEYRYVAGSTPATARIAGIDVDVDTSDVIFVAPAAVALTVKEA